MYLPCLFIDYVEGLVGFIYDDILLLLLLPNNKFDCDNDLLLITPCPLLLETFVFTKEYSSPNN